MKERKKWGGKVEIRGVENEGVYDRNKEISVSCM
jgi:hypothetical protein